MPSPTGPATAASTSSTASAWATTPSTKTALASLVAISDRHRFLVVLERTDAVTWLSLRNAPEVHIVAVDQLNTYDVVASDDVVFTRGAFDAFVSGTAATSERKTEQAPPPTQPSKRRPRSRRRKAAEEGRQEGQRPQEGRRGPRRDIEDFPGAVKADEDGSGPEGYEIKGNAQSMKFHAPGGRWYDTTIAEFWFQTAEDAEAAGFTEAGKSAKAKKAAESEEGDK